ncbi:MAG: nucleotidyltransferase family protein [Hyphomonadaceae bacterium]
MSRPDTAMVMAAGLGTRMRPLTDHRPKPLIEVAGKALIDHMLDRAVAAGVTRAVVNVHYLADMIEAHLARRAAPRITISDERGERLETGGGLAKAAPLLGDKPFFVLNTDQIWTENAKPALEALGDAFDAARMDVMMLLAPRADCLGFHGPGDFFMGSDGALSWRGEAGEAPWVYAGAYILHPRLLAGWPAQSFSALEIWRPAVAAGRFFGMALDGYWMHVGDPAARDAAEARLAGAAAA